VRREWATVLRERLADDALWAIETFLPIAAADIDTDAKAQAALSLLRLMERPARAVRLSVSEPIEWAGDGDGYGKHCGLAFYPPVRFRTVPCLAFATM
jgi:hypothetical protein